MNLGQIIERTGADVLAHLEREADVPVLSGMQAQGDLLIVPVEEKAKGEAIPPEGIPVLRGTNDHTLVGDGTFAPDADGLVLGTLSVKTEAFVLHREHGATGIAPGAYKLRRQREMGEIERVVAD